LGVVGRENFQIASFVGVENHLGNLWRRTIWIFSGNLLGGGGTFDQWGGRPSRRRVYIITITLLGISEVDMTEMIEEVAPRKSPRKGRQS
jgi:hypothetical protein